MPTAVAVTDTHALLWWASTATQKKLGRRAREHFQRSDAGTGAIYVPTIVLAELSELSHLGKIRLPQPFPKWMAALEQSKTYLVADLTVDIVRRAHDLFDIAERGDRLIAATALSLDVPLITRDHNIASCANIERLWD